jgi:alanine racemase
VVLIGRQGSEVLSASDLAEWGNTITWEILASLGARVPRVLVD